MKRTVVFPPVESATEDGLVAVGGDLEADTLEAAYRHGIFPWPVSVEFPLAWFSPDPRGIIDFRELHVSRSFEKFLKKHPFRVSYNTAFPEVIRACARMRRKGQRDTWITPDIVKGYEKFFLEGHAYSVEVWLEDQLVGGVYGVILGEFVSGESMFMKEDNASKLALYSLIRLLEKSGIKWLDTQMVTPVVEQFGGKYIPRDEFLVRLRPLSWENSRSRIFTSSG
jgi:leucyl/phenylalanyl-tRNA--protein transferase